eukprot:5795843-Prymnesium_polylepis.1
MRRCPADGFATPSGSAVRRTVLECSEARVSDEGRGVAVATATAATVRAVATASAAIATAAVNVAMVVATACARGQRIHNTVESISLVRPRPAPI